jgi:GDP-L-fucose synthase
MRILITGANGFLGKALCSKLPQAIMLNGKRQWDLTNKKHVDYALQESKPDVVIHLAAACGGIGINKEQPGKFIYDNLSMGMNLIEGVHQYGRLKKIIMIGTVCSYPKITPVPFKEENLWNGYPEETNAPYGIAKRTLIEMLIAYHKQYGLCSTNLIPSNMYGSHDNFNPANSHVIPALILKISKAMMLGKKSVLVWGTGSASREFLHVEDCADAIIKSIDVDTGPMPINIGTGEETLISTLVKMIAKIMKFDGDIYYSNPMMDGQPRRSLDTSRALGILDFKAQTSLYKGLQRTIKWYYRHEKFFTKYFNYID